MRRFIIWELFLIFISFSIMAESVSNPSSSIKEIKNNNEVLLKCSNIIGESPQKIGITENNVNNIFLKCLNSENNNVNMPEINRINSKDILLECSNTNENMTGETGGNETSNEKILKCSNIVKMLNSKESFQTDKIGSINGIHMKCSSIVKNVTKTEVPLSDSSSSNDIVLKCSDVSENLMKNEIGINNGTVKSNEIILKCSNIVRVIEENEVFSDNPENNVAIILSCSDTTEKAENTVTNIGSSIGNAGKVPIGPIIGGAVGIPAVGAIIGGIGRRGGGGEDGGSRPQNGGDKNDNKKPEKEKKDDPEVHNVRGIGIQPVNPFWRSNLQEAEDSYSKIAKVGFQWIRITASWHRIQSQKNKSYDWQDIDDAIALAKKYNLKVLMQISGAPEWATGADKLSAAEKNALNARKIWVASFAPLPQYDDEFSNFVSALVKRYAREGVIDYEFWNEPGES